MIDVNNLNEVQQRVYNNIHDEAIAFVKYGSPMKDRGPLWATITANALEAAKLTYQPVVNVGRTRRKSKLTPEQRLRRKQERMALKNGFSYDEWLKICRSHYSIDPVTFTVTSLANGPKNAKTWHYSTEFQAEEQVYKLMYWMYYNHHEREGCETINFRYVPDSARENENERTR